MPKGIIISGGNGGDSSEDCTVTAEKVVAGQKYIGADTNDDIGVGTLVDQGAYTIANSVARSGNTLYCRIPIGAYRTATAIGNPEINASLTDVNNALGLTATKVLAGQNVGNITGTATNDATATDQYVYSGRTYYRQGAKCTGSMTISSVVSFSVAAYSTSQVLCTWRNPAKGPYSGVIIRYKTGSYPSSVSDGTLGYQGIGSNYNLNSVSSAHIGGLAAGTTYYFRLWVYCNTSIGVLYSGYLSATCGVTSHGTATITTSQTWTVPANVRSFRAFLVGGGSGGQHGKGNERPGGDGGNSGRTLTTPWISTAPGTNYTAIIGAGGKGAFSGDSALNGGNTSFAGYVAHGGITSSGDSTIAGSGGGRKGVPSSSGWGKTGGVAGQGGTNGYYGYMNSTTDNTAGGFYEISNIQGSSTRAWGNANGTLYAGGGGGGAAWRGAGNANPPTAAGGAGGGGHGGYNVTHGGNGVPNTGSGGGGGHGQNASGSNGWQGGNGGSGIILIEW